MVEHSAVNRGVVGSSPTRGATPRDCLSESEVVCDCEAAQRLAKQGLEDCERSKQYSHATPRDSLVYNKRRDSQVVRRGTATP